MLRLLLPFLALALPAEAGDVEIRMSGATYAPAEIAAAPGSVVTFINDDTIDHAVFVPTAGHALDLGTLKPGESVALTLRTSGSFEVECVFHPDMHIAVEVGK